MREFSEALRCLPVGVRFLVDIRPEKLSADFPNLDGTLVRHRGGFVFYDANPNAAPQPLPKKAAKKPVAKRGKSVQK